MSKKNRRHLRLVLHGKAAGRSEIRKAVETVRQDGHKIDVRVTWEAGDSLRVHLPEDCPVLSNP